MKRELTIALDSALLPEAERCAKAKGISLASLIEQALRTAVQESTPTFASRWRGKFQAAERDDPRYRALAEKYRL